MQYFDSTIVWYQDRKFQSHENICAMFFDMVLRCCKYQTDNLSTVYPKKYAHGFCFAVLCCGYTLTDFPLSIRLTSLALWQSNDCPSASKATLMNMDKYFMWIHYERLHNQNKAKHNKTVCIFLGIYCIAEKQATKRHTLSQSSWHRTAVKIIVTWTILWQLHVKLQLLRKWRCHYGSGLQ